MSYCIIETGSKQYRVKAGDTLEVDRLTAEAGKPFTFERVLFVSGEDNKLTFGGITKLQRSAALRSSRTSWNTSAA